MLSGFKTVNESIMLADDMPTSLEKSHIAKLDLLKALFKNGLRISPKKCQLFRTKLQYVGNTIFIQERRVCVKPLRSWLETIQKLQLPTRVKGSRSLTGMVNFLSFYVCPELQKIVKAYILLNKKK